MLGNGRWKWAAPLAVAAALSVGSGCVQDVGDIDRTQPDKIKKALFQNNDEWYVRQSVVDTDMQGSMIFEALDSDLKRIRWTITENVLYAYSTVELNKGLNEGFDDPTERRLGVVAAYPIQGHFDVQRQYNPSTGETTNVIIENGSDRPWYEREYMRVDWSTNLVDGWQMFSGWIGSMASAKYRIPETAGAVDPDRTRISDNYIDTVTEFTFSPDVYACYGAYGMDAVWNCEGGRLRVRSSFLKIPAKPTYVPFNYTDNVDMTEDGTAEGKRLLTSSLYDSSTGFLMEVKCDDDVAQFYREEDGDGREQRCTHATFDMFSRFGFFRTERVEWDRYTGGTDSQRRYYANRWNIWQSMLDDSGNVLEMSQRKPKPITYHLNPEYPSFMFDAAQETAQAWDKVFKNAVSVAKGLTIAQVEEELQSLYGHKQMFRIVENSCHPAPLRNWKANHGRAQGSDRMDVAAIFTKYVGNAQDSVLETALWALPNEKRVALCAELEYATETRKDEKSRFSWERVGDLRYSFFNWVEEDVPWAGYGPSAADPATGEIISGNANFAGGYIRRSAFYAADLIKYFNGELDADDIRHGNHVRDYLKEVRQRSSALMEQKLSEEGKQELARRAGPSPYGAQEQARDNGQALEVPSTILKFGKGRVQAEANRVAKANVQARRMDTRRMEFLEKPEVKALLMRDVNMQTAVEAVARERFGNDLDDAAMHQAYLEVNEPRLVHERDRRRAGFFAERNIMTLDTLDRSAETLITYRGVADYFKGKSREELTRYFQDKMFIGTQLHEIGHTVGLRHNFAASTDALNYYDGYWDIQKAVADGKLGADDVFSIQGELAAEIAGAENVDYLSETELRLASVMDYTGDLTGRFGGMGKYDQAAINFAYAEHVEQWDNAVELPNLLQYETWFGDYKELPRIYANQGGRGVATDPEVQKRGIDVITQKRVWVPIREAVEQRRAGILNNTANWRNGQLNASNKPWIDRTVDYAFCTDDRSDYELGCDVWDFGANQREAVNHAFETYRIMQPFWRYKRASISRGYENYNSYVGRVYQTLTTIERPFRYYSIYQWWNLGSYTDDLREAAIDAVNFYGELLAMPEPGRYCKFGASTNRGLLPWYYDLENTYVPAGWDNNGGRCANYVEINPGQGQYFGFDYTDEYEYRITRVGTYIDKLIASQMMFDISANFAYASFFTDQRATNISYWTLFKDEFLSLIRGVVLGDFHRFAGTVDATGTYTPPMLVDKANFGKGRPTSQQGQQRLFSPMSFNHEFQTLVGGMIYASNWEDRELNFNQYVKVYASEMEAQELGPDVVTATFVHPNSGQIYVAPQTADGQSITVELIDWANRLKVSWQEAKDQLDAATPGSAAYQTAWERERGRSRQMEDVIAKIDMIRYVWQALGPNALR